MSGPPGTVVPTYESGFFSPSVSFADSSLVRGSHGRTAGDGGPYEGECRQVRRKAGFYKFKRRRGMPPPAFWCLQGLLCQEFFNGTHTLINAGIFGKDGVGFVLS